MSERQSLVPTDVRIVEFYGDELTGAVVRLDGEAQIYIPLRPLCAFLGLDWSGQRQRTMRDEVLRDKIQSVVITPANARAGDPEVLCIPLPYLPGWLFGVSPARVKPELRERITLYRRECYERLWDAFKHDILQSIALAPMPQLTDATLAYETAIAVASLAREQMELEARQVQQEGRLNTAAQWARGIDARVTALELRLPAADDQISTSQATEIMLAVKTVANALERQGRTNGYQRVYGELYRRFSIGSYKSLPQSQFQKAMTWLKEWYDELGGAV